MDFERDVLGILHQRQLGLGLAAAQAVDDRARAGQPRVVDRAFETEPGEQRDLVVHRQPRRVAEPVRDEAVWALFLFPGIDVAFDADRLSDLVALEARGDVFDGAVVSDQRAGEALRRMPRDAGEIAQARRRPDQHRAEILLLHLRAEPVDARAALVLADGGRGCACGHWAAS